MNKLIAWSLFLLMILASDWKAMSQDIVIEQMIINSQSKLITFTDSEELDLWKIVNDTVMGGLSTAKANLSEQFLVFSGRLSTQNNGGFSSIYRDIDQLSDNINAVEVNVLGDGKTYQLRSRALMMGYVVSYKAELPTTEDVLTSHVILLSDFKATFRGRLINNAPKLSADKLASVGFLISSKANSHFSVSIKSINFREIKAGE